MKSSKLTFALLIAVAASAALFFALFFGSDNIRVQAQTGDTPTPAPEQGSDFGVQNLPPFEGNVNPPKHPNLDSMLNQIVEQVDSGEFSAQTAAAGAPLHDEDSVAVTLYITEGNAEAVRDFLSDNGASPRNVGADYIEAYIPVSLLASASRQAGVISVRTIIPPQPAQGAVVSEGAAAHGAPAWHAAGQKGAGVKIGVIDTGFEKFSSLRGTELPSTVQARCYTDIGVFTSNLADCETPGDQHGTAVTETIFDIAPEATYYISNGVSSWGDLKTAVEWMVSQDVDVINHSVGSIWGGPGDGTSPFSNSPLRTVDTAVGNGIAWVNSAGNEARATWFGDFTDTDADGWHNFVGDDECNSVTLQAGERFTAQLRWDDSWGGANKDLELDLFDPAFTPPLRVAWSHITQAGGAADYPLEGISYTPIINRTYCLAARQFSGATPGWIQLQSFTSQTLEHHTLHHSIGSPAESANPGLLAVGAADWRDTSTIEWFSSQGPTPDGRVKPDIVGADRGRTVAYRTASNPNGNFFGTSQSSPHVAGLAALVMQRFPDYSPAQVANYLKNNAAARGGVPNNTWGYGFAMLPASDAATPEPTPAPTPEPTPVPTPEPTATPTDPCFEALTGDATVSGTWTSECVSESLDDSNTYYSRFYTFTLGESAEVTITLESTVNTYLYLLSGTGKDGNVLHENDDHDGTNSRIQETLQAGSYTIDATTFDTSATGDFTLTVAGLPDAGTAPVPTPTPEPTPGPTPEPTPGPTPEPTPTPAGGYTDVSRGTDHACALHTSGSIACWGANTHGQASPPSGSFTAISSGDKGTCAVRQGDGVVVCWGSFQVNGN